MDNQLSKKNANVILITIDCLRGDHLSCNGYSKQTSPFLDKLSQKGVNFSQAISTASWTAPSFISILTSTYPLMYDGYVSMTKERLSIAEVLKNNGYLCAGFPFHAYLSPFYKYNKGFDFYQFEPTESYEKSTISMKIIKALRKKVEQKSRFHKLFSLCYDGFKEFTKAYYYIIFNRSDVIINTKKMNAKTINDEVIKWIKSNKDKKFFLWMHYLDTHTPYLPPLEYLTRPLGKLDISKLRFKRNITLKFNTPKYFKKYEIEELISLYDSSITYVDDQIKIFLKQLESIIDLKNTYVIITSDHGDAFFEHGRLDHGLTLYEELIHVPLIISGPDLPSKNIDIPVSLIDLAPTILDFLDVKSPPIFIGRSLTPTINSDTQIPTMCFSEEGQKNKKEPMLFEPGKIKLNLNYKIVSLRGKKWKYIFNEKRKDELYNLIDDPGEKNNLIDSEKSVGIELKLMIDEHLKKGQEISNKRGKLLHSIDILKHSGKI